MTIKKKAKICRICGRGVYGFWIYEPDPTLRVCSKSCLRLRIAKLNEWIK